MSQLIWSPRARRDLIELNDWFEQLSSDLPLTLTLRIEAAAAKLVDHPQLGPKLPDSNKRVCRARQTPYVLIYRPTREGVRILRVRHARSDWKPRV